MGESQITILTAQGLSILVLVSDDSITFFYEPDKCDMISVDPGVEGDDTEGIILILKDK